MNSPAARLFRWLIFMGFFLGLVHPSHASTNSPWSLRAWQSDDNLPNNNVTGLAQTSDGYLWISTPARIARFDGVQFEDFSYLQFTGAYRRRVRAILGDRQGGLCLAIDGGLAILHRGTTQIFTND